jgi:phage gp36-like protein
VADVVYADRTDLARFGVQASATKNVPDDTLDAALLSASGELDGYFRARYSLPLIEWDTSVRQMCCWIAAYHVMGTRGYSQDAGRDEQLRGNYEKSIAWAEGVERQRIHPKVTETPVAAPRYQFPQISTGASRGWTNR